ncbi:aminopeptidase N, partial [Biomphalaria glabrata]
MSVKKLTDGSSSKTDLTTLPVSRNKVHLGALAGFILFVMAGVVGVCVVAHITGGTKEMDSRCDPETILSGQRSECLRLASQGQKELCEHCPASKPHRKRSIQQRSVVCLPGQIATDTTNITTTNATTTEKPKLTNYRLPTSLYPTHYNIEIQTYIIGHNVSNFFFKGSVKIWLRCDQPSDNVTLHLNGLEVDESSLLFYGDGSGFNVPKYTNWSLDTDREFFILNLDGYTEVGKTYIIEISYTSPIKKNMKGLYLSSYQRINQTVYQAATQFQPTDARKAFPCFDEPAIKSTFNVTLVRPSNMTSLSNMPIINNATTFTEEGVTYVKDVFAQSKIMSAYLVAFVVSDFSHLQRTLRNGVLFRTWSRPEVIATTEFSLDIGTKMFLYFEEFFDVKYPMPKLDMIPIPDFPGGGMENWGLITYKEKTMLYKEKVTEASEHFNVAVTVAHELAHM